MSNQNHHGLRWADNEKFTAAGEIVSVSADQIVIGGIFNPGLSIELRPGRRVYIITEDEA
jgi:hypothetical protein